MHAPPFCLHALLSFISLMLSSRWCLCSAFNVHIIIINAFVITIHANAMYKAMQPRKMMTCCERVVSGEGNGFFGLLAMTDPFFLLCLVYRMQFLIPAKS